MLAVKSSTRKRGFFAGLSAGLSPKLETVPFSNLDEIEIASEDGVKRLGGTVGWGVVGGTLLGPVGLLAGLLAGGQGKDVTFVATFSDGRKLLATTDAACFKRVQAAVF